MLVVSSTTWSYLYYIAGIAISSIGFASLFLVLRQILGEQYEHIARWSIRHVIGLALCYVLVALVPPLTSSFGVTDATAARVGAAVGFFIFGRIDLLFFGRRKAIYKRRMDLRLRIGYGISIAIDVGFAFCAQGIFGRFAVPTFYTLITCQLAVMFHYFERSLESLLPLAWDPPRSPDDGYEGELSSSVTTYAPLRLLTGVLTMDLAMITGQGHRKPKNEH